jgi:hypothetical protein
MLKFFYIVCGFFFVLQAVMITYHGLRGEAPTWVLGNGSLTFEWWQVVIGYIGASLFMFTEPEKHP